MKHIFGEKKEKNSKKILSPQLFVFVRCLSRKTNPIKSSSFNLFRVLSLSALLSRTTTASEEAFCFLFASVKVVERFSSPVFVVVLLFDDERERDIYHTQKKTRHKCRNNRR